MTDPDDPEDVLKHDADPDSGEHGDDAYDALRYGLAAHPAKTKRLPEPDVDGLTPELIQAEAERQRRSPRRRERQQAVRDQIIDPNFGVY